MLTEQNKKEIYSVLISKFSQGESYPLAVVGKELTLSGYGCRKYQYARMKEMMMDMQEYLSVEEYEQDGHSNCNVTIFRQKDIPELATSVGEAAGLSASAPEGEAESQWGMTSATLAEDENELGGGLSLAKPHFTPASAPSVDSEEEVPFTDEAKHQIYKLLLERFSPGREYHMAAISKFLVQEGHAPKHYGFSKMKTMLQQMDQYLSMQDTVISGVPNVLITILGDEAGQSEAPEAKEEDQEVRSTSGGVRFTGAGEGSTFKEEPAFIAESRVNVAEKDPRSTFERLTYLPPKVLDYLRYRGMSNPEDRLAQAYEKSLQDKSYERRGQTISFPISWEGAEEGTMAILRKNERPYGKQWYLSFVGSPKQEDEIEEEEEHESDQPIPPGKAFEHFADIGLWAEFLKELAALALPERWETDSKPLNRNYVLKKYIQYTFYRLQMEDKICISHDGKFAAFNTGLVNNHYDDIFVCFVPNLDAKAGEGHTPPWKFEAFAIAGIRGKDGYGKTLTSYFDPLPQVASYVQSNEDLLYDLNRDLITDFEHIILNNLNRMPLGYLRECSYGDEEAQNMIEIIAAAKSADSKRQAYAAFSRYISDHDKIYRRLRSRMEDAIEIALKRVRWNFRTAIPCYFPKGNSLSLMLPLCMEDDTHTDAALVVQKNPSGSYQGQTVLQLDQAYLDARLICRPNADWLQQNAGL